MNHILLARYRALFSKHLAYVFANGKLLAVLYTDSSSGVVLPTVRSSGNLTSELNEKMEFPTIQALANVLMGVETHAKFQLNGDIIHVISVSGENDSEFVDLLSANLANVVSALLDSKSNFTDEVHPRTAKTIKSGIKDDLRLLLKSDADFIGLVNGGKIVSDFTFDSTASLITCIRLITSGEAKFKMDGVANGVTIGTTRSNGILSNKSLMTIDNIQLANTLKAAGSMISKLTGNAEFDYLTVLSVNSVSTSGLAERLGYNLVTTAKSSGELSFGLTNGSASPELEYIEAIYFDPIQTGSDVYIRSIASFGNEGW